MGGGVCGGWVGGAVLRVGGGVGGGCGAWACCACGGVVRGRWRRGGPAAWVAAGLQACSLAGAAAALGGLAAPLKARRCVQPVPDARGGFLKWPPLSSAEVMHERNRRMLELAASCLRCMSV